MSVPEHQYFVKFFEGETGHVGSWCVCEHLGCKDLSARIVCDCYEITPDEQALKDATMICEALNAASLHRVVGEEKSNG